MTVVIQNRECLFGDIENGKIELSEAGEIVRKSWEAIPDHYPNIDLDYFIIIPNHIHGIIIINYEKIDIKPQQGEIRGVGHGMPCPKGI